ncbi:J domain-containing protein [Streptomyces sp. NRRL S-1448]|uniref:J domain-containing protein n=1 Tax=Streptomyces sp. NRRL S-1448 TaxID=1463883 RepID=UPI001F391253|nr:J domain-containing protein [Streptomyces sp. NRRL S-1448]
MTNSHAENTQDGQHRADGPGTADALGEPQAPDARDGGQGAPAAGTEGQPAPFDGSGSSGDAAPSGEPSNVTGPDPSTGQGASAGQDPSVGPDASAGHSPSADQAPSTDPDPSPGQNSRGQNSPGQGSPAQDSRGHQDPNPQDAVDEGTRRLAKAVLAAEQALIEFEIAVETFRVEVENFSRLHHQRLGPMYARLDELDAQIAEAVAARTGDPEDIRKAHEARASVLPMPEVEELFHGWMGSDGLFPEAQAMLTEQPVQPPQKVRPSEEVRKAYRELVRKAHPDLARDDAERARRDAFIARVNAAYGRGDEAALRELAREWEAGPAPAEERLSESEELYARLEWLATRKELLAAIAAELEESAIGAMIKMAPEDPDRLLDEIAEKLLAGVAEREAYLTQLVG